MAEGHMVETEECSLLIHTSGMMKLMMIKLVYI